jgi:leader peptidase (prepilin peptidase)/N-methyltransferase
LGKGKDALVGFSLFIVGLIFGSFLNMLIYRLPLGISLFNPKRSICTKCNHQLYWYENIPLISYIFLKGRCSNCKAKISIVYPIVELVTAIVTSILFFSLGLSENFLITVLLFYTLIVLSFIDFEYKAVPDYLLIIALCISFFIFDFSFKNAMLFAGGFVLLELFITFYIQNIKSKIVNDESLKEQRAMGEGDIPIVAIIGGVLGIKLGLIAIFLAALFAIVPALLNSIIKKDIETPFIPFLALGFFIAFVFNDKIISLFGSLL